jgi:hypothetical protein
MPVRLKQPKAFATLKERPLLYYSNIQIYLLTLYMKRKTHTKKEHAICKQLKTKATFTITYKDYGKDGWEFDKLECSCKKIKPTDCTCDLRRGALLLRGKM